MGRIIEPPLVGPPLGGEEALLSEVLCLAQAQSRIGAIYVELE